LSFHGFHFATTTLIGGIIIINFGQQRQLVTNELEKVSRGANARL
jgi:hypothetical protein